MLIDEKLRWYGFWLLDAVKGGKVRKYYNQIHRGFRDGTSLEETREKLQKLIAHAVRTTVYYKEYPEDTPLEQLPVVNKDTFREQYEKFQSSVFREASDNRIMCTSGSTGTPLRMIQNKDKIDHNTAGGIFLGAVGGYYIGMKEAFLRVWVNNVKKSRLRLLQENLIMMDSSNLDDTALSEMTDIIRKKKVKCLVGYSSALGELSRYIDGHQIPTENFQVKAVIPISEALPKADREALQRQFSCPVRAWYSNEENGIMGIQNKKDEGYHIDTESYYYEILKMDSDEPAEPGELGRIVITELYNYAFPIIRYDNGDTAIARKRVKDGRYQLFLTELYGRRSDLIYDCEGRPVTPYIITNNMWDVRGVRQFRFIQMEETEYTLWLNGNKDEIDEPLILGRIQPHLGERARITIEYVDEIPVLQSGKRKYIENRCEKYRRQ